MVKRHIRLIQLSRVRLRKIGKFNSFTERTNHLIRLMVKAATLMAMTRKASSLQVQSATSFVTPKNMPPTNEGRAYWKKVFFPPRNRKVHINANRSRKLPTRIRRMFRHWTKEVRARRVQSSGRRVCCAVGGAGVSCAKAIEACNVPPHASRTF